VVGRPREAEGEGDVTDKAAFSSAEWGLLVRLPQWVAKAASAAQADGSRRSAAEEEAGLIAIAKGREWGNPIVEEIARQLVDTFDDPETGETVPVNFADAEAGIATVYERAQMAARVLAAKADATDAVAYRRWLLNVADVVIGEVRSGAVLGVGGDAVSEQERRFRDHLASVLQG
jgi:hypothetical protein